MSRDLSRARAVIVTPRLELRELVPDDLDFLAAMLGDAVVTRVYAHEFTRADAEAWLAKQRSRYAEDGHGLWLALSRESGEPVGQVGLLRQELDNEVVFEIAYMIDAPFRRRGFALEAATRVRDHAFGLLDKARVVSFIRPDNAPSIGVARKVGMSPLREVTWAGMPHVLYAVERGSAASSGGSASA